jgi:glycosyltransferase involved in cell wall biosynthesis
MRITESKLREVLESGLFDEAWYRASFPDVVALPISPVEHYLRFGACMGRSPGPRFDAVAYLDEYPDVCRVGMNPLLHYVQHGRHEGREIFPLAPDSSGVAAPASKPSPLAKAASIGTPPALPDGQARKLPLTALVITWDVGHNPLGRSYMLAEVLDRVVRNVVLVGFQFPRYGSQVWEPVREGALPVIVLPGQDLPQFAESLDKLAERVRPDIVIACKPRLPSVQLGVLIKEKFGCPLILDIDDHEMSFFQGAREVGVDDLAQMADGAAASAVEPFGPMWTGLAQHMRKYADEILVSNVELQRVFGGTIVAHVRDEHEFDPARHDRDASRDRYGVPRDARVLLFFGTPREHKGINVLAEAVGQEQNHDTLLVVVGSAPDKRVVSMLDKLSAGRVVYLPNQPFSAIPGIVAMADVVCLPQDETSEIARYQLPAKAIDAIGMGIPLLATRTAPLMQLIDDGVALAVDRDDVATQVRAIAGDRDFQRGWAERVRSIFLDRYSYRSAARQLREVIERALASPRSPLSDLPQLLSHQRRVLGAPAPGTLRKDLVAGQGVDVVVLWKQNDTGLYGRRSDMTIRYLANRSDVRRILVFDAPISEHDLVHKRRNRDVHNHDRLIYRTTYEKALGQMDSGKVSHAVFIYPPGRHSHHAPPGERPGLTTAYLSYMEQAMERAGVVPSESVFWVYPKNYLAPEAIEHFHPARVVVDVVDDHRAWPGITDAECARLTENYRELLARADMAFANCEPVVESMRGFCPQIRLVPNGCDEQVQLDAPEHDPVFREFAASTRRKIGFVGNLEKKIDIELIGKIASHFPDCMVVLLGSTHANPDVLSLLEHPNVLMPGVVPYRHVGAWVSSFDVGIIPHLDMELTRSMNPLKLYVYLSCRVPVVSTEIYNVDRPLSLVRMASSHEAFIEQVESVLREGRPADSEFDRYIQANGWRTRFQPHLDELFGELAQQGARTGK